jgi:hypothetical protein
VNASPPYHPTPVDVMGRLDVASAGIDGESPHGCSPVVSNQTPMWLMPINRHRQWRRMPGHCVGPARWPVDLCRTWVSTERANRGLLVPSIAEKRRCGRYPPPSLSPPEQIACWRPTPTTIISNAEPMPARMGPGHHESGFQTPCVVTGSLLTVTTPVARPSALSTTVTCASDAAQ